MRALTFTFGTLIIITSINGFVGHAEAAIISTSGAIVVISPPSDARTGHFENDHAIHAFAEQQNVTLPNSVAVDVTQIGSTTTGGVLTLSPGTISAGTVVSSYFLHFDDVGSSQTPVNATGSLTFNTNVLGVAVLSGTLNATDAMPGLPTTIYASGDSSRGFEPPGIPGADILTLSSDRRTVTVNLQNVDKSDDVRIITAAVPEPSSLVLLCIGTALLVANRYRGCRT